MSKEDEDHLASFLDSLRRVLEEQRPEFVTALDVRMSGRDRPIRLDTPSLRTFGQKRMIVTMVKMSQGVSGPLRASRIALICKYKNNAYFRAQLSDLVLSKCLIRNKGGYLVPEVLPEWFVSDF